MLRRPANANSRRSITDILKNPAEASGETTSSKHTVGGRGRRNLRRSAARGRRKKPAGASTGGTTTPGVPADFSGTYAGRVTHEALGVTDQEATLTVTGTSYTLSSASLNYSGRFVVNTTDGYHAVTMELGPPPAGQPFAPFISVRARRVEAGRLILTSVPGERLRFSFVSGSAPAAPTPGGCSPAAWGDVARLERFSAMHLHRPVLRRGRVGVAVIHPLLPALDPPVMNLSFVEGAIAQNY